MTKKQSKELSDICLQDAVSSQACQAEYGELPEGFTRQDVDQIVERIRQQGTLVKFAQMSLGKDASASFMVPTDEGKILYLNLRTRVTMGRLCGELADVQELPDDKIPVMSFKYDMAVLLAFDPRSPRYSRSVDVSSVVYGVTGGKKWDEYKNKAAHAVLAYLHDRMNFKHKSCSDSTDGNHDYRQWTGTTKDDITVHIGCNTQGDAACIEGRTFMNMTLELTSYNTPVKALEEELAGVIRDACKKQKKNP